jgi:hypothetical protein
MNKRGITTLEVLMWLVGGAVAFAGYVHMTFATYREVVPRLDRIETLIIQMKEGK